jgi:DNA-binding transcriptional MerR regulator
MKAPDAFRTISEVAGDLDLPQHVLRFWETRFVQIKPMKRGGGRRYYRPEDIDLLRGIRLLLYGEGFTIRGVQRLLKEKGVSFVVAAGQTGSVETVTAAQDDAEEGVLAMRRPRRARSALPADVEAPDEGPDEGSDPMGDDPPALTPAPRPVFALAPDRRRRMEAALSDLEEAKRLLDQAR